MIVLFTNLSFSKKILEIGDNEITVSYSGISDNPNIKLELGILSEPRVNFKVENILRSCINIPNKLTSTLEKHYEVVVIKVKEKPSVQTPVSFIIYAQRGSQEEKKRRRNIYF